MIGIEPRFKEIIIGTKGTRQSLPGHKIYNHKPQMNKIIINGKISKNKSRHGSRIRNKNKQVKHQIGLIS